MDEQLCQTTAIQEHGNILTLFKGKNTLLSVCFILFKRIYYNSVDQFNFTNEECFQWLNFGQKALLITFPRKLQSNKISAV